jgi:hypothetical protein
MNENAPVLYTITSIRPTLYQILLGQIKKNEMDRGCITYHRYEKCTQNFRLGKLKGKDHLGDLGVGRKK